MNKYIIVTFKIEREGKYYTSHCPELGTASFGLSQEEALENIKDATLLYLNTLEDLGECAQVLKQKGVKVLSAKVPVEKEIILPTGSFVLALPAVSCA